MRWLIDHPGDEKYKRDVELFLRAYLSRAYSGAYYGIPVDSWHGDRVMVDDILDDPGNRDAEFLRSIGVEP